MTTETVVRYQPKPNECQRCGLTREEAAREQALADGSYCYHNGYRYPSHRWLIREVVIDG